MSLSEEARPPSLIEAAALATLERAINAALRADPVTAKALNQYSGRLVAIRLTLPSIQIFVLIVEDAIELYHRSDAEADVGLQGSAIDLLAQVFEWRGAPSLIGGPVSIRGDRELLQQLIALSKQLNIDWGAVMEPLVGSELAQQIDVGARRVFDWGRVTLSRLGGQISEYFREESSLLALRHEVYEFNQDVDELRMDTDRLSARITQLKQKTETRS